MSEDPKDTEPAAGAGAFLGRGWAFPVTFLRETGTVRTVQGVEDIEESLELLLSTEPGERLMRPDYGCALQQHLLFEPLDASVTAYIKALVEIAILYHEPRIELRNLRLTPVPEEGRVDVAVEYVVRTTNSRHNYVFPYYVREGTNLKR